MSTIYPDADLRNADWTKATWDLPPYKSPEFMALLQRLGITLAKFKTLPVFQFSQYAKGNGSAKITDATIRQATALLEPFSVSASIMQPRARQYAFTRDSAPLSAREFLTHLMEAELTELPGDALRLRAFVRDGGPGSGDFNHPGRPPEVGGSAPGHGGPVGKSSERAATAAPAKSETPATSTPVAQPVRSMAPVYGRGMLARVQTLIAEQSARTKQERADVKAANKVVRATHESNAYKALYAAQSRVRSADEALRTAIHQELKIDNAAKILAYPVVDDNDKYRADKEQEIRDGVEFVRGITSASLLDGEQHVPLVTAVVNPESVRSQYEYQGGDKIVLSNVFPVNTVVHETGHWLEAHSPAVHDAAVEFLQSRIGNTSPTPINRLVGAKSYNEDEVAVADHFIDAYTGKVYPGMKATEVISMGLQYLHSDPASFAKRDPEMFTFMVDILRGNPNSHFG